MRVRPAQLPRASWRCAFHPCPPFEEATYVYDVDSGSFAGMLCECGAYKYPVGRYGSRRSWERVAEVGTWALLALIVACAFALIFIFAGAS